MASGDTPTVSIRGDAKSDDTRLAAAGAGEDEQRAPDGLDGQALLRVQLIEKILHFSVAVSS